MYIEYGMDIGRIECMKITDDSWWNDEADGIDH
jgi:hypothetical protein